MDLEKLLPLYTSYKPSRCSTFRPANSWMGQETKEDIFVLQLFMSTKSALLSRVEGYGFFASVRDCRNPNRKLRVDVHFEIIEL